MSVRFFFLVRTARGDAKTDIGVRKMFGLVAPTRMLCACIVVASIFVCIGAQPALSADISLQGYTTDIAYRLDSYFISDKLGSAQALTRPTGRFIILHLTPFEQRKGD